MKWQTIKPALPPTKAGTLYFCGLAYNGKPRVLYTVYVEHVAMVGSVLSAYIQPAEIHCLYSTLHILYCTINEPWHFAFDSLVESVQYCSGLSKIHA